MLGLRQCQSAAEGSCQSTSPRISRQNESASLLRNRSESFRAGPGRLQRFRPFPSKNGLSLVSSHAAVQHDNVPPPAQAEQPLIARPLLEGGHLRLPCNKRPAARQVRHRAKVWPAYRQSGGGIRRCERSSVFAISAPCCDLAIVVPSQYAAWASGRQNSFWRI
jgi:hypothetical protein